MSHTLQSHSPDLKRLRDEGYDLEVRAGYLLVKHVPYVNSNREIQFGTLVSELTLAGEVTTTPSTHVAMFIGEHPCKKDGTLLTEIQHGSGRQELAKDLVVNHSFSAKPNEAYKDYYAKMTIYIDIISRHAYAIDPRATAITFPVIEASDEESVFAYLVTASSRAEINVVSDKLRIDRVAIVGLGGTGSYVLDLVAKTPVREIHLFDGDTFLQHNAFRSPGAPSVEELRQKPKKVHYFRDLYSRMHRHIHAHDEYLDASNLDLLQGMTFVFLCVDRGGEKRIIVDKLEELSIPFIDVGMDVQLVENTLTGSLRVTSSSPQFRSAKRHISFADLDDHNEYAHNIQIADLNAINAALAVIRWKKMFRFYADLDHEHASTYTINGNILLNDDRHET